MGAREVSRENEDIFTGWKDRMLREFLTSGMVFWSLLHPVLISERQSEEALPQQSSFLFSFEDRLIVFLFSKGYVSLSQVVRRTRNKLAPWENSCSSSGAVLPWLASMKLLRMLLLATLPALSQSCKKLKSRLIAACSFIEVMISQSWSWLRRRENRQVTKVFRTVQGL